MTTPRFILAAVSMLSSATVLATDAPVFDNNQLTVPRIDSPAQVGLYQDVVLRYTAQGRLDLLQLEQLGAGKVYNLSQIQAVEVKKAGTLPVSVYLQVSGAAIACDFTGPARAHQRLQGTTFDVNISAPHLHPASAVQTCTANIRSFKVTVPLQVYGLAAGTYSYNVNGITGSFVLEANNRFADDCDVMKFGNC